MTDTFHEDKLKAARIYIAELIDKLDAAKFELAAVRNATLEEAELAVYRQKIEGGKNDLIWNPACDACAAAIRALAPSE